ncbi:MAG: 16S rRNA (adenine(1518)-N(6)/adenine(1519)-N(6))-dimethyltransferase RsmA [Actinomycetota bacterium]
MSGPAPQGGLGIGAIRDLATRFSVRPSKSLGQNFLTDPNLARAIASDAGIGPGDHVVEVGAGFGSLTLALAASGADVTAVEFDRLLIPALQEVTATLPNVSVVQGDAMKLDWRELTGASEWTLCANLPYNIATPLVLDLLAGVPFIGRFVVMVQREAGERLVAQAGEERYGAVSVRVRYAAHASLIRSVPAPVFWPRPTVESVVVRLDRLAAPAVDVDRAALWRVIDVSFAERRKTMRNALRRMGLDLAAADRVLAESGVGPSQRPEELPLEAFARIADRVPA